MTNRPAGTTDLAALVVAAKGLAHPARLRALAMLADGELCVCQLIAVLGLAPSTVSEHLAVLARGGWVSERKEGKLVFYRLAEGAIPSALAPRLLELAGTDETIGRDRAEVARLREVPIAELCAAELDLVMLGVRPASQEIHGSARAATRGGRNGSA